jgi:hypothetical protein
MTNHLRPDEIATESRLRKSRERDENLKKGLNVIGKGVKTAANIGLATAGATIASRVLPFLSEHIPVDLAIRGISKVSPKLGDFLKKGMSQGLDARKGMEYIRENIEPKGKQEALGKSKPNKRNVIEQYSDELHEFLDDLIKKGRSPLEAGALAQLNPKFKNIISKLEKDHKAPFSSILQAIYGQSRQPEQDQSKAALQGQQQPGQGQQALMAILQKINQMRGGS